MNEKIGCLYYDEEAQQYSIVGPGTIVRCTRRLYQDMWVVEQSYGHTWEEIDILPSRNEAILRMIHHAWELT